MLRAVERMQDRACEPAPAPLPSEPHLHLQEQQQPLPQQPLQSQQPQLPPRQSPRKRTAMQTEEEEEEEEVKAVNCGKSDHPLETREPNFREGAAAESKETSSGSRRTSRCSTPMSLHLELSEDEDDTPLISSEEVSDLDDVQIVEQRTPAPPKCSTSTDSSPLISSQDEGSPSLPLTPHII